MLRAWLNQGDPLAMSTIAWAQFLCGPVEATHIDLAATLIPERIAFEDRDASLAATLFNDTGRRRGSLADCMIAATALRGEAQLATLNRSDFNVFETAGLLLAEA